MAVDPLRMALLKALIRRRMQGAAPQQTATPRIAPQAAQPVRPTRSTQPLRSPLMRSPLAGRPVAPSIPTMARPAQPVLPQQARRPTMPAAAQPTVRRPR